MKFIRHSSLLLSALPALILTIVPYVPARAAAGSRELLIYFGTYTRGDSKGIYAYRFQPTTGKLTPIGLAAETVNPSFVAIHPNHQFLYSVSEIGDFQGQKSGAVSAFSIDAKTGLLKKLNTVSSKGSGPCYVRVDQTGKTLLVANYGSGSIAAMPIKDNGELAEATSAIQHAGSGANKDRQSGPHAHSINPSPDNRFAVVADLGLDEVLVYRLDAAKALLTPNDPPFTKLAPASGPRHFAFDPSGKFGYVINEMNSTVTAFSYDKLGGTLKEIQTITTLPKDFTGKSSTAEVQVHPSGKFLYGSNRGHDSIAIFTIDKKTGKLTTVGNVSTQGKTPRNFGIDPSGKFLFAANQDAGGVVVFRIDAKTGNLTPTGDKLDIPFPVCVKFMPAGN
jgi:6-phosphogluconolactonase